MGGCAVELMVPPLGTVVCPVMSDDGMLTVVATFTGVVVAGTRTTLVVVGVVVVDMFVGVVVGTRTALVAVGVVERRVAIVVGTRTPLPVVVMGLETVGGVDALVLPETLFVGNVAFHVRDITLLLVAWVVLLYIRWDALGCANVGVELL